METTEVAVLIRSGKSKKRVQQDRQNFYSSTQGQALMQQSDEHQKGVQSVANDLMSEAAKENRGLNDTEIGNALDNLEVGFSHRPGVRVNSRTSSASTRYVAKRDPKTGKTQWVPIR